MKDMNRPLPDECQTVNLLAATAADPLMTHTLGHSAAHLLGAAMEELYPDVLLCDGPAQSDGRFFYNGHLPFPSSTSSTSLSSAATFSASNEAGAMMGQHAHADNVLATAATVTDEHLPKLLAVLQTLVKVRTATFWSSSVCWSSGPCSFHGVFGIELLHSARA